MLYVLFEMFPWVILAAGLGLLLGWWLWHRWKALWTTAKDEQDGLRREIQAVKEERHKFEVIAGDKEKEAKRFKSTADSAQGRIRAIETGFVSEREEFDGRIFDLNKELGLLKDERKGYEAKLGLLKNAERTKENLEARVKELEEKNEKLAGMRTNFEAQIRVLEANKAEHDGQLNELRESKRTLEAKVGEFEPKMGLLANFESDKSNLEDRAKSLQARVDELEGGSRGMENQIAQLEGERNGLRARLEDAEKNQGDPARIAELESEIAKKQGRIAELEGQITDLDRAAEASGRVGDLENDNKNLKGRIGELEAELNGLRDKANSVDGLNKDNDNLKGRIGELEAELNDFRDKANSADGLNSDNNNLKGRIGELEAELNGFRDKANSVDGLNDENNNLKGRIGELEGELNGLREKAGAADRVGDLETAVAAKEKDNGILRETIADLERRLQDAEGNQEAANRLGELEGRIGELEGENNHLKGQIGNLENERNGLSAKIGDIEPKLGLLSGLEHDKSHLENRIRELEGERDGLHGKIGEIEPKLGLLSGLENDKNSLEARLRDLENERNGLENERNGLNAKIGDIEGKLGVIPELENTKSNLTNENDELRKRLEALAAEKSALEADAASQDELEAAKARADKLQTKLQAALDRAELAESAGPVEKAPDTIDTSAVIGKEFSGEDVRSDDRLGILYNNTNDKDDLELIKGIGPKIHGQLNDHGVYRFKQIANWTDPNVSNFSEELNCFPGRIDRDRWIPQARGLADMDPDNPAFGAPHEAPESVDHASVMQSDFAGESVKKDQDLGIVYESESEKVDDLKRIRGVGPVMEQELNGYGVYRFKQIATWDSHNVDEFADRLNSFPDRIARDRWIPQAEYLAGLGSAQEAENAAALAADFAGETNVKSDAELGILYTSRPDTVDELTRIKGVGPVIETKLHDFGVYRFKQIANWNQRIVDEFAERLGTFKDRISRDDWISQAKELGKG